MINYYTRCNVIVYYKLLFLFYNKLVKAQQQYWTTPIVCGNFVRWTLFQDITVIGFIIFYLSSLHND